MVCETVKTIGRNFEYATARIESVGSKRNITPCEEFVTARRDPLNIETAVLVKRCDFE